MIDYNTCYVIIYCMNTTTRGTMYILISSLFYASYGVWARLMGGVFGEFNQAWTRGMLLLIFVLMYGWHKGIFKPIPRADWKWFIVIALCGGLNQAPYYLGFQGLGVGTGTVIFYATLLIGGYLIGAIFFRERLGLIKIGSLLLALIGIGTIYQLSLAPDQLFSALAMMVAAMMGSVAAVLPKKLSGKYHEFQIMSGYFVVMVVANGALSTMVGEALPAISNTTAWLGQLGYTVAMLLANATVIEGFRYIEASVGSLIGLAEIILGVMFGYFLFTEPLSSGVVLGSVLIILSAALPILSEMTNRKNKSQS